MSTFQYGIEGTAQEPQSVELTIASEPPADGSRPYLAYCGKTQDTLVLCWSGQPESVQRITQTVHEKPVYKVIAPSKEMIAAGFGLLLVVAIMAGYLGGFMCRKADERDE